MPIRLRATLNRIAAALALPAFALPLMLPAAALAQEEDTLVVARAMDVHSLDPARAFGDTCQIDLSAPTRRWSPWQRTTGPSSPTSRHRGEATRP